MGNSKISMPDCPANQLCSEWAKKYLQYCLCSMKDELSLSLGIISVVSWAVAEIPQIMTNYQEKSTDGLSIAFLVTWIIGDIFNVVGCLLEPATLPTQYYMAVLYTITTTILTAQTVYYVHIYHRLKRSRQRQKTWIDCSVTLKNERRINNYAPASSNNVTKSNQTEVADKVRHNADRAGVIDNTGRGNDLSSPIPFLTPTVARGKESYYVSARSLSRSHTPTVGSCLAQRMTSTPVQIPNSVEEPLLGPAVLTQSAPTSNVKTMLSVVSIMTFLGTLNLYSSASDLVLENEKHGVVLRVGRKLLQVGNGLLRENGIGESSRIGNFLGWGMASIYLGGRLPQIFLIMRKGNVEGLNPFMFIFALLGNSTYVASILVNSMDWSTIRPNLPWLVDAGGCVFLDSFILAQFIYYRYWKRQSAVNKSGHSDAA